MDHMRIFLTPEIISCFHEKAIEFTSENRMYCSSLTCSAFLYPSNITGDKAECPICMVATCTICNNGAHEGDCPLDTATQQALELATGEGWRRCSKCKAVVELGIGCNHITCRCKAEWCYVCGANWKTCGCPTWTKHRLLERAAGKVNQAPAIQAPAIQVPAIQAPPIQAPPVQPQPVPGYRLVDDLFPHGIQPPM